MRGESGGLSGGRAEASGVVAALIALCVAVFGLQTWLTLKAGGLTGSWQTVGELTLDGLKRWELWRVITFNFVHGDPLHLLFNGIMLWVTGRLVLMDQRPLHVVGLFFAGGVTGGLLEIGVFHEQPIKLVGASAGIWALFMAAAIRLPGMPMMLPFFPGLVVRLKNLMLGLLVVDIASAAAQYASNGNFSLLGDNRIASLAHVGGAIAGFLYIRLVTGGYTDLVEESLRRERRLREDRFRRREPPRVLAAGRRDPETRPEEPADEEEFMESVIDPILEKVHIHGIHSLSPREAQLLRQAAARLKKEERP